MVVDPRSGRVRGFLLLFQQPVHRLCPVEARDRGAHGLERESRRLRPQRAKNMHGPSELTHGCGAPTVQSCVVWAHTCRRCRKTCTRPSWSLPISDNRFGVDVDNSSPKFPLLHVLSMNSIFIQHSGICSLAFRGGEWFSPSWRPPMPLSDRCRGRRTCCPSTTRPWPRLSSIALAVRTSSLSSRWAYAPKR